jgi:DNA-directed RNA polymerase subunit alpha
VKRVAYSVESARVGQRTDYDKLTLDIETDGSVDPHAALREAAELLIKYLAIFSEPERVESLREAGANLVGVAPGSMAGGDIASIGAAGLAAADGMDDILIEELELGVRSYNCLKRAGVQTVSDLVQKSESELNAIPNFGRKSIEEVMETLEARGLALRAS